MLISWFLKVNAVKNEEASQISRLNDEIRMLRMKLEGQAVNQVNSSVNILFFSLFQEIFEVLFGNASIDRSSTGISGA